MIDGMNFASGTALMVVNLSPFVEDAGCCYINLVTDDTEEWPLKESTYYISLHYNCRQTCDWSTERLKDMLETRWMQDCAMKQRPTQLSVNLMDSDVAHPWDPIPSASGLEPSLSLWLQSIFYVSANNN